MEPIAAVVFFAPEFHRATSALGFREPESAVGGVRAPDQAAYIVARAACLGQDAPSTVVAAAFGVFDPRLVDQAVREGRELATAAQLQHARCDAARAALRRLTGDTLQHAQPLIDVVRRVTEELPSAGRALFSALQSIPYTGDAAFDLWHAADLFREHRGDSHIMSWSTFGLSPVEACLINDLAQGLPIKSYVRTRGWQEDDLDRAVESLTIRGAISGGELTDAGRALRDAVEECTDRQQAPVLDRFGDALTAVGHVADEFRALIVAGGGYPQREFVSTLREWK